MTRPSVVGSPALPRGFAFQDVSRTIHLRPVGVVSGASAASALVSGRGRPLAGGPLVFTDVEILIRHEDRTARSVVVPLAHLHEWALPEGEAVAAHVRSVLDALSRPRPPFAGLELDRPLVMGIVNVTPDSFSDGGDFADPAAAIAHGRALRRAGADILDIGGESTRPDAEPVSEEEEMRRVLPVVRALAAEGATVSIDTRHAGVMAEAVRAGAAIINDVSALTHDPRALEAAAASGASVVLMHMLGGDPRTMQADPRYDCAPLDVLDYLAGRVAACRAAGIPLERLCVDPGIGFGKTVEHNLEILGRLGLFHELECAVLLGVSRKSFIARLSRGEPAKERLAGSLTAGLAGLDQGVQILRVHDVVETVQAVTVWRALHRTEG